MASPISFTIELRRCWTTDRVMGSIFGGMLSLREELNPTSKHPYWRNFTLHGVVFDILVGAYLGDGFRRRLDDGLDIPVRHRRRQCHQSIARRQHAPIEQPAMKDRGALAFGFGRPGRAVVADRTIGKMYF